MPNRMRLFPVSVLVAVALSWATCCWAAEVTPLACTSDFEGGSGVVVSIDQAARSIVIEPTPHEDRGWVCWWYVKVTGITPGETIRLEVRSSFGQWAKPERAAFSTDNRTWKQTAAAKREKDRIEYRQAVDGDHAWFAWGPPFVPSDAQRLVADAAARCPMAEKFELCRTLEGRTVPALRIGRPGKDDSPRYGVWIGARQHAWESGSSWVCRGLVEWLLSDDPRAAALRQKAQFTIVPIMDVDNAFRGAGGKRQKPHDHNRDWSDEPHWPSVAAAQKGIKQLDERGALDLYVDLHNPAAGDRQPFFFMPAGDLLSELGRRNQDRFIEAARAEITGPLALAAKMRESGRNYDPDWQRISGSWVAMHTRPHVVSLCLETSWDTPDSNVAGYMAVGRQLGQAIERYFRDDPRAGAGDASKR